jgi:hypothetical protein
LIIIASGDHAISGNPVAGQRSRQTLHDGSLRCDALDELNRALVALFT